MSTPPDTCVSAADGTGGQDGPVAGGAGAPATGPPAASPAVEPDTLEEHPLRARDVPALIAKRIG